MLQTAMWFVTGFAAAAPGLFLLTKVGSPCSRGRCGHPWSNSQDLWIGVSRDELLTS